MAYSALSTTGFTSSPDGGEYSPCSCAQISCARLAGRSASVTVILANCGVQLNASSSFCVITLVDVTEEISRAVSPFQNLCGLVQLEND